MAHPVYDGGGKQRKPIRSTIRKERPDLPAVVPPVPDNPMGSHALRLSNPTLLIHGTDRPWGIGTRNSHGCIRLYQEDIARLFGMARRGTKVVIVRRPVKAAYRGGRVYLQVHDNGDGSDPYREALKVPGRERKGLLVDVSK